MRTQRDIAHEIISNNSIVSTKEMTTAGIHKETIRRLIQSGDIISITRGLYSSPQYIPGEHYSLIIAQKIVKKGVVCLQSALSFHNIGTQNPSEVWMAIPRGSRLPKTDEIPVSIMTFSGAPYSEGIETHKIENNDIMIYSIPKTIADCFKFRNKIGLDVAVEALKDTILNKRSSINELIHYAEVCRVANIMRPYMESVT
ncbi:MAG: type IV toxin-antitoxin system AbiEi family antitoxin domain-containing protein [Spirochaetales bacterium]|nr:type IV toxin-antitoxin system AbiEi family antitoxin domain-containing protein [Spirochaetales bacterium]